MKEGINNGGVLSFGEYIAHQSGTCRENGIFMHLGLLAAGVPNQLAYSELTHFFFRHRDHVEKEPHTESHAFVLVEFEGQRFIVDSYFHETHGVHFDSIHQQKFIDRESLRAPWAYNFWSLVPENIQKLPLHINKIHSFPTYWTPRERHP